MGFCRSCVFVIEMMKRGFLNRLPEICNENFVKDPKSYHVCHQVLNAFTMSGDNLRYWIFEGCYKYENYGAREWIRPCPSHVICSVRHPFSELSKILAHEPGPNRTPQHDA